MRRSLVKASPKSGTLISVIPSEIIEDFGLKPGDKLDFRTEGDHIIAIPLKIKAQQPLYEANE